MIFLKSDSFDIFAVAGQAKPATLPHCLAYMLHPKYLGKKHTQHEKDIVLEFLSSTDPGFLQVPSASTKDYMLKFSSIDSQMLLLILASGFLYEVMTM